MSVNNPVGYNTKYIYRVGVGSVAIKDSSIDDMDYSIHEMYKHGLLL